MSMIEYNGPDLVGTFVDQAKPPIYYMNAARHARQENDTARLRRLLNEGTQRHPQDARLWHEYAKSLRTDWRMDELTLSYLERAHRLAPLDRPISMDLASLLVKHKQFDRAERIYIAVMTDEGENPRLLCAMGHGYQRRGRWPLALACFSRALELAPEDSISLRRYEEMTMVAGRPVCDADRRKLQEYIGKIVETLVSVPLKQDIDNTHVKRP